MKLIDPVYSRGSGGDGKLGLENIEVVYDHNKIDARYKRDLFMTAI